MAVAGMHNAENRVNTVLRAPKDLAFSIDVKRERQRKREFHVIGCIEQIIFENDRDCSLDTPEAMRVGRRLYWPHDGPLIAKTIPEEDLIFVRPLKLPLPDVPDPLDIARNPYKVDQYGHSHLAPGEDPVEARKIPQKIERIASARYRNFLVFHPVAQIILLMIDPNSHYRSPKTGMELHGPALTFGSIGDHRMPVSSLTGWDGRKMAVLIDPYTGEAFFTGGRYQFELGGVQDPAKF